MKKQSFLCGAAVLAATSILCKMMSALLKIPLDRFFLHEDGIAIYQSAYSIYNVFLAICITGIPIALSGLIAASNDEESENLYESTFVGITLFGIASGVALFFFAPHLAMLLAGGNKPMAVYSLRVLSPALPLMGMISSGRGYFQGKSNMTPSSISQLAESIIKVFFGIGLCAVTIKYGIAKGAAGAICSTTLGTLGAALTLRFFYLRRKTQSGKFSAHLLAKVVRLSVPMTLGAFSFTAVMLADSLTVPSILALCGNGIDTRLKLLGYLTRANTVYNLPATIITAFTASAVPAIAFAAKKKDNELLSESCVRAVKLVILAAAPCMLGMILFSKEIFMILYSSSEHSFLLAILGVSALVLPYVQATTAMLQTLGKVWPPIAAQAVSVILKTVLNFFLIKKLGIEGAPLSTVIAFLPSAIFNSAMLFSSINPKVLGKVSIKIFICAIAACSLSRLVYTLNETVPFLIISCGIAVLLYGVGILLCGCIKKEEFYK